MKLEEDIKKAVEVMRQGGVILYPTDTIWGIGCDATNEEAVARVYRIKSAVMPRMRKQWHVSIASNSVKTRRP